jgi:hypothetical protein
MQVTLRQENFISFGFAFGFEGLTIGFIIWVLDIKF